MNNMKDSNINWIGLIPKHWKTSKVKYLFEIKNGATPSSNNPEYWDGDISWITPADMEDVGGIKSGSRNITEQGYYACGTEKLPIGSIVISNRAPIGKINFTEQVLCTNQGCKGLVRNGNNKFYYYFLLISVEILQALGRGTTFMELSTFDLGNLNIVLPPSEEQRLIAEFLDSEVEKINDLIRKTEKQIELLEEYKKSLITETVTKGLDKTIAYKDTGIGWIGEIPENWEVTKIKYISEFIGSGATPDSGNSLFYDGDYNWIQSGDLYKTNEIVDTSKKITEMAIQSTRALKFYESPYLVIAMYGASIGNIAISKIDSYTNQACCVIKLENYLKLKFLFYYLYENEKTN